jgi:isochorismate synthase
MNPPIAEPVLAGDVFDLYQPRTGFVLVQGERGLATVGPPGGVVPVAPGPDQVRRAAHLAAQALQAGDGAVVSGALPFDGAPVAFLHAAPAALHRPARSASAAPGDANDDVYRVVSTAHEPDEAAYQEAVAEALRSIDTNSVEKVVLARTLVVETDRVLDPSAIARRLHRSDPDCHVFAVALPGTAHALVGASPELLLRRRDRRVASDPLAGSAPRSADPVEDRERAERLLQTVKERREHRLVAEAVADTLSKFCENLEVDAQPSLVSTATLWHLHTAVRGRLRPDAPDALTLAAALHPTPAVCGTPPDAALGLIRELEPFDRRFYAGMAGWVDAHGDGDWVIVLRCAEVMGRTARLYAGAGIVAGSDPEAEDREADIKFSAMLHALGAR